MPTRLCKSFLLALPAMLAQGCTALEGGWPDLAGAPEADPVALESPVAVPEPARAVAPMAPAAASRELETLAARLADLEARLGERRETYQSARADARSADTPRAVRTAQFHLSRLSALENRLARLEQRLARIRASELSTAEAETAAGLSERVSARRERLAAYLAGERERLAALSGIE